MGHLILGSICLQISIYEKKVFFFFHFCLYNIKKEIFKYKSLQIESCGFIYFPHNCYLVYDYEIFFRYRPKSHLSDWLLLMMNLILTNPMSDICVNTLKKSL